MFAENPEVWTRLYRILKIRDTYTPNIAGQRLLTPETILFLGHIYGLGYRAGTINQMKEKVGVLNERSYNKAKNIFMWAVPYALTKTELDAYQTVVGQDEERMVYKPIETLPGVIDKLDRLGWALDSDRKLRLLLKEQPHVCYLKR